MLMFSGLPYYAPAQGYVDQERSQPVQDCQGSADIRKLEKVQWHFYHYNDHIDSVDSAKIKAWPAFEAHLKSLPGFHAGSRRYIVELANRLAGEHFKKGQYLLVPDYFTEDYRAYSPYPFYYPAADTMAKLFVIDKYTQTFGAYEKGWLVRWGIVSSGNTNAKTPPGRYNFNWKAEYRISNASPPGEVWELYYMFNFHAPWGIHLHQYALPIGRPASHGCVRTSLANAIWNYHWANEWVYREGKLVRNGTPVIVINDNPPGNKAVHWRIENGKPESLVKLPDDLMSLPAGTYVQDKAPWASGW